MDSFPPGSVTEFPDGRFFLIRSHDGGFLAVYQRCTHLGCSVTWEADEGRFVGDEALFEKLGTAPSFLAYPRGFYHPRHKRLAREAMQPKRRKKKR